MRHISQRAYNIFDLREIAQRRLPRGLFEFLDRGCEDDVALRNNRAAFDHIKFKPRVLVDVSARSQEIELFGQKCKMPIAISPTGNAGLLWYEGEMALARAAAAAGIPLGLSTHSLAAMERIIEETGCRLWFQTYLYPDRSITRKAAERARAAGCEALIVLVDGAAPSNREYNLRNGFTMKHKFNRRMVIDVLRHPRWLCSVLGQYAVTTGMPRFENQPEEIKHSIMSKPFGQKTKMDSLAWEDLRVLRKLWPGILIVKGILHPGDAVNAADCGADGVIVSNHGGRHLDNTEAPIDVLPEIVDAVGKRLTVMVDSGFRRGSDVIKALALGAQAVMIGRPTLYGTAAAGEEGATHAITIFRQEIDRVLALIGCRSIAELNHEYLT